MPSIIELGMRSVPALVNDVSDVFNDLESKVKPLREELLEKNVIRSIPEATKSQNPSVITVDGASVVEQLAGVDVVSSCAVSAEGIPGTKTFSSIDDAPKMLWQNILTNHSSSISTSVSSLMSLQEMILMEHPQIKDHDLKIIDGSWTSALLSVLPALLAGPHASALMNEFMSETINKDYTAEAVFDSIVRRLKPWDYLEDAGTLVAISKSDSNRAYGRFLARYGIGRQNLVGLSDRILSMAVLEPGEMMIAVPMTVNHTMIEESNDPHANVKATVMTAYNHLQKMPDVDADAFQSLNDLYEELAGSGIYSGSSGSRLASPAFARLTNESWMWTSYFKPHNAPHDSRPMKFDFVRPAESNYKGPYNDFADEVTDHAGELASLICLDTYPTIKEPMSQYLADKAAKQISVASRYLIESIASQSQNSFMISAILSNYRT